MIAIRKEKRKALIDVMVQLDYYVVQVNNGDRAKLLSSGFDVSKESIERRSLATIQSMVVKRKPRRSQDIGERGKRRPRVRSSVFNRSAIGYNGLGERNKRSSQAYLYGVETVGYYWFRVIAIGLNGRWAISYAVSRIIL